ncbi:MAG: hypothetical protein FJ292_04345 [Planctomycetes bacterium]|nr:hypothetical protein [Planctomycetota bacterium]
MNCFASCMAVIALTSSAFGQQADLEIDGTLDAEYANPKASQVNYTSFGNATDGVNSYANGSELDGGWIKVDTDTGNLYIFLSGNLESNFNKLDIFIDCVPSAGQNEVRSDNPDVDFNGLNRMGRGLRDGLEAPGLKFDADFAADFFITTTLGGDPPTQYANIAQMLTDGGGVGAYIGSGPFSGPNGTNLIDDQVYGCQLSINNSNTAGVSGDSANPGSGCGVTTGIEIKIPLVLTSWDGSGDIKVCAFINGQGHDYASNQVITPLPEGSNNLGGDGTGGYLGGFPAALRVDFSTIAGNQYFSTADADACAACFGDLDASGDVDNGDVAFCLLDYGQCASPCAADLDLNGEVDFGDVALILLSVGPCS